jgi:AcrR family transcriptional regulator
MYERKRRITKRQLMEAGLSILLEDGYDAMTITRIADRADYGRGTFYEYFKDKEDFIVQIIELLLDQHTTNINQRVAELPSPQREYFGWIHVFRTIEKYRDFFKSLHGRDYPSLMEQFSTHNVKRTTQQLEQGVYAYGEIMQLPIPVMASFVASAMDGVIGYWLSTDCELPAEEIAGMMFKMLYHIEPPIHLLMDTE